MTDDNVISFPRIGFTLTPGNTPDGPATTATDTPTPASLTTPAGSRRSPLDLLTALPSPALLQPAIPTPDLAGDTVPATFRSDGYTPHDDDLIGPRLGALSLAAILAVAVAALRGAHTVGASWWDRRQARLTEADPIREARLKHQLAMQGIQDKAAQQRAKQIPSSQEYGRKTLNRSKSGGSGSGGAGGGQGGKKPSTGNTSGPRSTRPAGGKTRPADRKPTPTRTPKTPKPGSTTPRKNNGSGAKQPAHPKAPHRKHQGAANTLNKHKPRPTNDHAGGKHTPHKPGSKNKKHRPGHADSVGAAVHKNAARRLKKRRKNTSDKPPVWTDPKNANTSSKKRKNRKDAPPAKHTDKKTKPTERDQEMWRKLKQAAARRWKQRTHRPPHATHGPAPKPKTPRNTSTGGGTGPKARRDNTRGPHNRSKHNSNWWTNTRARAWKYAQTHRPTGTTGPTTGPTGTSGTSGTSGSRRSPFENAAHTEGTTWTVVSEHVPGSSRRQQTAAAVTTGITALPAAPTPHTPRPGTSRPQEPSPMPPSTTGPDPRIVKARHQAARTASQAVAHGMDAQHATEITLDDACDGLDQLTTDAFATHDESQRLATKARSLRDTCLTFADYLAVNHNLIGPLFTAALARFAESMDLVARMADEMETSSLEAAEKTETASNEMNDAYRPYNTATADAGLTTPSAPIHNEE
ncbi:hypothetical protein D0Z67_29150 (plasmid) [Streptomyces seoulensis]|uniref:Uncharacterized protein n=1 Tax=Streptomyces seoulensis TaxID=73044 RepID=A0A4P6U7X8_STRSO|nr:hypothetical protein [Streptomyces seoulensis]QBJ94438.1 hypothetical protein D0Z67_29150 [Streptomyces seoulensis]